MVGTILAAMLLIGGAVLSIFASFLISQASEMFADMGEANMPSFVRGLLCLGRTHLYDAITLLLFCLGLFALIKAPGRLRANVYASCAAIALLIHSMVGVLGWIGPVVRAISTLGQPS